MKSTDLIVQLLNKWWLLVVVAVAVAAVASLVMEVIGIRIMAPAATEAAAVAAVAAR